MAIPVQTGLATLHASAQGRVADPRLQRRLEDVQLLLATELMEVEQELTEVIGRGPEPGTAAALHLVCRGGKRVRPVALLLSAACFGEIPPVARHLAAAAELVHSATLLHDDVIDDGKERRGVATARRIHGNAVSVLSGDLLLVAALEVTQTYAPALLSDLIATLRQLVEGEIIQLRGRTELDVSEMTYERILRDKTASLFSWATRTGARLGGATEAELSALSNFGERLGIAFQLVDDVLDYAGNDTGKSLFADLREGKLTLPLVLTVAQDPSLQEDLKRIHAGAEELVAKVSEKVIASGTCDEVRRRAQDITRRAVDELGRVRPGAARQLLEDVAHQLADRAR